jgi:hypothetical protein
VGCRRSVNAAIVDDADQPDSRVEKRVTTRPTLNSSSFAGITASGVRKHAPLVVKYGWDADVHPDPIIKHIKSST